MLTGRCGRASVATSCVGVRCFVYCISSLCVCGAHGAYTCAALPTCGRVAFCWRTLHFRLPRLPALLTRVLTLLLLLSPSLFCVSCVTTGCPLSSFLSFLSLPTSASMTSLIVCMVILGHRAPRMSLRRAAETHTPDLCTDGAHAEPVSRGTVRFILRQARACQRCRPHRGS